MSASRSESAEAPPPLMGEALGKAGHKAWPTGLDDTYWRVQPQRMARACSRMPATEKASSAQPKQGWHTRRCLARSSMARGPPSGCPENW
eukprot:3815051-Alexandrium_andersonii.AAC.1